jgi:hypothetical protein
MNTKRLPNLSRSERAAFWAKVDRRRGDCWNWTGSTTGSGYPQHRVNGEWFAAHRLARWLLCGDNNDGLVARHLCGNPCCCRASHIRFGTPQENAADRVEHGRAEYVPPKLTPEQRDRIRAGFRTMPNLPARIIAMAYGVSRQAISRYRVEALQ